MDRTDPSLTGTIKDLIVYELERIYNLCAKKREFRSTSVTAQYCGQHGLCWHPPCVPLILTPEHEIGPLPCLPCGVKTMEHLTKDADNVPVIFITRSEEHTSELQSPMNF